MYNLQFLHFFFTLHTHIFPYHLDKLGVLFVLQSFIYFILLFYLYSL